MTSPGRRQRPGAAWAASGLAVVLVVAIILIWVALRPDAAAEESAPPATSAESSVAATGEQPSPHADRTGGSAAASGGPGTADIAQPAPSQVVAERPRVVRLPSGTEMPVDAAATGSNGLLVIPTDINRAGWWNGSSRLGDPFGSIVLAAHIDSFTQGLGRFAELLEMRPGDGVTVESANSAVRFRVVSAKLVPKSALSATSQIYSPDGDPRLVLITCGGAYDADSGGYQDNMVVEAIPIGAVHRR